ncbi:uncharacterized protein LOC112566749 [Pomacea canaliculata]|uniref:uncharacterized protein LOC112566749 n=1 Tax=Pomacea canaliculata TaxID=400727 RepID=UPI000D72CB44|nr:uncharacterized protein LOC112566749 [Pomacea canaliculata]
MFLCSRQFDKVLLSSVTGGVASTVQSLSKWFFNLFIMKYVLSVYIFTAFFINLTHCNCVSTCLDAYTSAAQGLTTEAQICPIFHKYLDCLQTSCQVDLSPFYPAAQEMLKQYGVSCNLNAASRTHSGSLLAVFGAMLLTTYGIFNL